MKIHIIKLLHNVHRFKLLITFVLAFLLLLLLLLLNYYITDKYILGLVLKTYKDILKFLFSDIGHHFIIVIKEYILSFLKTVVEYCMCLNDILLKWRKYI